MKKMIIIDDEEDFIELYKYALKDTGIENIEILEAKDGKEGLNIARKHIESLDLIVMDNPIPGIEGKDFAKTIRDEDYKGKIMRIGEDFGDVSKKEESVFDSSFYKGLSFDIIKIMDKFQEYLSY